MADIDDQRLHDKPASARFLASAGRNRPRAGQVKIAEAGFGDGQIHPSSAHGPFGLGGNRRRQRLRAQRRESFARHFYVDDFVGSGCASRGGFTLKSIGTLTRVITGFPF